MKDVFPRARKLNWTTKGQSISMKLKIQEVTFKTEIILFCREIVAKQ
jgi:hypothetical protein